jgi:hypothetical protein
MSRIDLCHGSTQVAVGLLLFGLLATLSQIAPPSSYAGSPQQGHAERGSSYLARHFHGCGVVSGTTRDGRLRARASGFKVSCRKARRIVESYMKNGWPEYVRVKGFSAWKCSSGSEGGTCQRGKKYSSQAPEIDFNWV